MEAILLASAQGAEAEADAFETAANTLTVPVESAKKEYAFTARP